MTRFRQIKTNFTAGEVSRRLLGRGDLRAYENGALSLRNVVIHPTGGLSRRPGFAHIDTLSGTGRLLPFEFNTQQTYLIVLLDTQLLIYAQGSKIATLTAPWAQSDLYQISWTQSADTLLLSHPDYAPQALTRNAGGTWVLSDWAFFADPSRGDAVQQPYYKFSGDDVSLTPDGTSGTVNVTASENLFLSGHEGTRLRIEGKEVLIDSVASPTVAACTVIEDLNSTNATTDWKEQSFSPVRGYPVTAAFHQDRLVIGGSRDLPNRLWFSKSGDLWNFDLGTGLDDEAIEFGIFSDQINAIRAINSSRDLQVFTSGAEWQVSGSPLTPTTVQLSRQTRIGSPVARYVPPLDVDGATMFIARNGQELREFLYTDLEAAYQATDLALTARHLLKGAVDQSFNPDKRLLFVVRDDGKIAALTLYRTEKVSAWTQLETDGEVISVTTIGADSYILTKRGNAYAIEVMDDDLYLDAALTGESVSPTVNWSGLDHLNGLEVSVIADGIVQPSQTVSAGAITLSEAASTLTVGLPYTHVIEPLPPSVISQSGDGRAVRLIEVIFRLEDTAALRVDVGNGLKDIPLRNIEDLQLDQPAQSISEDIPVRALGWRKDLSKPLWKIEQSLPLPFTLLAVQTDLKIGG